MAASPRSPVSCPATTATSTSPSVFLSPAPATQTLQVPGGRGGGGPPSRRGTNIATAKRTRFALQVQKPTGEEEAGGGSVSPGVVGESGAGLRAGPAIVRGGQARRSRSPGPRGGSTTCRAGPELATTQQEEPSKPDLSPSAGRGGRGGRGRGRGAELRHYRRNGLPPTQHSGSTDTQPELEPPPSGRGAVPARALDPAPLGPPDPAAACSPITLEYAEELLLMARAGRCTVMDLSEVPILQYSR